MHSIEITEREFDSYLKGGTTVGAIYTNGEKSGLF